MDGEQRLADAAQRLRVEAAKVEANIDKARAALRLTEEGTPALEASMLEFSDAWAEIHVRVDDLADDIAGSFGGSV